MKNVWRRLAPMVAIVALLLGSALASTAAAAHVACGQTITQNTTLESDVGPCADGGITIAASNITLDLGGRTVRGTDQTGDDVGILLDGVTGVTVRNGRVINFDAGVVIDGGSGHTITNVVAQGNIGTFLTDFGDGIAVFSSSNNVIRRNRVQQNGLYSGISLVGNSDNNLVDSNTVQGNNIGLPLFMQDVGIRVEGRSADNNTVSNNKVEGSGLDGIQVTGYPAGTQNTGNILVGNTVRANGFHGAAHRTGNGIVTGGPSTVVERNTSERNAASGIRVNGRNSIIRNNTARNNAQFVNAGTFGGAFDLHDTQPECDANVWTANIFITRSQPCIN